MRTYVSRAPPSNRANLVTTLRSLSTVANIPSYQHHPGSLTGPRRASVQPAILPTERASSTISIPSYQYHPSFPPGVMPHPSPPKSSYARSKSASQILSSHHCSYTTAFALFEAIWEVRPHRYNMVCTGNTMATDNCPRPALTPAS
jgi:hypothetical protein